jgi:DNA-directed RNA polymerase subunit beta
LRWRQESKVEKLEVFFPEKDEIGPVLSQTLKKDPIQKHEEALIEIYRRLRPGDPPTLDSSRNLFENMFFNAQKYDFSRVGRLKLNTKLKMQTPLDEKVLHPKDFFEVIKYLLKLRKNPALIDDIDHLGNRACARSASCSRISSGSAWSAWSGRSRKRCRSTRKWRPPCRTT